MFKPFHNKTSVLIVFIIVLGFVAYSQISSDKSPVAIYDLRKSEVQLKKKKLEEDWVNKQMENMSLREKVGQFFMVAAYSNRGETHFQEVDSLIRNENIGGLIFFQGQRSNLVPAIARFQSKSKIPLLMGMDAEWGV
ncbi:MAG: hypothetical protein KC454_09855, partial [Flavobacteriales bacterium]|nr:hypothetical protein [Flavobacteriales bacterium]